MSDQITQQPFAMFIPETGQIIMTGMSFNPKGMETLERAVLITNQVFSLDDHYVHGNEIHRKPEKPGEFFKFDYAAGVWVLDKPAADLSARSRRSQLLAACDWTQMPDVPLETKAAWQSYRQALRDITEQPGYPVEVEWPVQPHT